MSESVGHKLAQARHQRGLTIDEAAYATKLRPDKILALENDDYATFASTAYAKGFLKNYARYLGVDVAAFLSTMDSTLPISVADYQYLSNAPERPAYSEPVRRDRKPPSVIPLLIGAVVIVLAAMGFWVVKSAQRIFAEPAPRPTVAASAQPATPAPALPAVAPDLAGPSTLSLEPTPAEPAPADPRPPAPMLAADRAILKGGATANSADHDVVTPVPVPTNDTAPAGGVNEILVASVKKTWITVRKDDPKTPPIFEDYLYPGIRPLKIRGVRFFIEARDPSAVQITKNGLPIAYQAPGVPIQ